MFVRTSRRTGVYIPWPVVIVYALTIWPLIEAARLTIVICKYAIIALKWIGVLAGRLAYRLTNYIERRN